MALIHGVTTVIPAPKTYEVDFANPTRDLLIIRQTYWVYGVGTALAFIFLAQNLYVKLCVNRKVDAETASLIIAWALSLIVQGLLISTLTNGLTATHAWEISLERYNYWTLIFYTSSTIYTPTSGFAKMSLLCFYSKLSRARWWIWCIRISFGILAGYTVAITCAMVFACHPIQRSWDVTITAGGCVNRAQLYIAIAALQILSDLGLLLIPMPMIYGLHMPSEKKMGLAWMFVIGSSYVNNLSIPYVCAPLADWGYWLSTLVTSVMRLVTLIPALSDLDQTWGLSRPVLWICVEGNLLVICASLPTVRRFLRHVAPRWIGESEAKKSSTSHGLDQQAPSHEHHPFRTFGAGSSARKKKQLDTLGMTRDTDEPAMLLQELESSGTSVSHAGSIVESEEANGANRTWDARPAGGGSDGEEAEQSIVVTKTYLVTRSNSSTMPSHFKKTGNHSGRKDTSHERIIC
ncbi:hypothetical protein PG984_014158 [Apiospora sp. TS-2023a]